MAVSRAYDGLLAYPSFDGAGGTSTTHFSIPRGTGAITVIIPDLDGVGTTVKFQLLNPIDLTTWGDVLAYDPGDGSMTLVGGLVESTTVVVPASALGQGVFRLVASVAQTTPSIITVLFDRIGVI